MRKIVIWTGAGSCLAVAIFFGLKSLQKRTSADAPPVAATTAVDDQPRTLVELSEKKFSTADLHTVTVEKRPLQHLHTVPGKIDYNGVQRIDLKTPVESTVQQVLVKPGDTVQPGTRLAVLDSPDIGLVRAEVEKNRADLKLATRADEWAGQIADNSKELLDFLQSLPTPQAVEKKFENKPLGDQRQHLLTSYSRYILAEDLWRDLSPLIAKGSVSVQAAKQRESSRDVAKAEFQAAREQSRFDQQQQREKARAASEHARQILEVSRQRLRMMLGAFTEVQETPEPGAVDPQSLTRYFLIAPIAGTVEQRSVANGQRVPAGQGLFVVANTASLWVTAELREHDWPALQLKEGAKLTLRIPALEGKEFPAEVSFVGRSVSSDSQAVPLIATVGNAERMLKPGMFAWVVLPIGAPELSLAVPIQAILTHDNQKFVFVEESPRRYRRTEIVTGLDAADWIGVTSGLQTGQKIVDRGTFLLKSELLLESEE
jgi:RND family efflux transporter MFP subunit